ncbi:MAG: hypothetical protein H0T46_13965 [Deltaproteobacteria bacterium]|nr:hypothetical protein [Deltaproteobacteria bacterium]
MPLRWFLLALVGCSAEKAPPDKSPEPARAQPVDENAPVVSSPEIDREVARILEIARAATSAATEVCKEGTKGPRYLPTITLDGLEALANKQPLPPSASLSSLALYGDLQHYRAGTLARSSERRVVDQLQKLRKMKQLGVYEVKTFSEGDANVEGQFDARLVLIDMGAAKPICHVPLSIKLKRDEPDPSDPHDKPRTFASKIRAEVDGTLGTLFGD